MKKKILGITAFFAVLAVLSFTACVLPEIDDGLPREVTFINHSEAEIRITVVADNATSFTLNKAASSNDNSQCKVVTRNGKDIELTTISITSPTLPDPWTYVEISNTSSATGSSGKDGLKLKAGTIIFQAVKSRDGGSPLHWDVEAIPQDE